MTEITPQFLNQIQENPRIKRRLAFEHPLWFSLLYLRHHFSYSLAPFHLELFHLIQQTEQNFIAIMAFRESGKSTIMNTANVLWSILGKPEKKFVLIVSKTQEQAKSHFANIKAELENNTLLKEDFGPFAESADDLKRLSLELVYHESKIMSVTREQSIRGLKYGQYRPDLIICDDLEDISSAFDHKETETLYERFEKEMVPLGNSQTRIVVLGNLISKDSFMMKLREDINERKLAGVFRIYPLLDDNGKSLWPSKYPDLNATNNLRSTLSKDAWEREYLLTFNPLAYHGELPELADPLDYGAYMDSVHERCEFKFANIILPRYRDVVYIINPQKTLVRQMEAFTIHAPGIRSLPEPEPGDPRYEKYIEYQREIDQLEEDYKKALKITIIARAKKKAEDRKDKV